MQCCKCPFLEEQLQFQDVANDSALMHHGNWDQPQMQYFCALDPNPEGWQEVTPMLPQREAEEAIKDAVCHRNPQQVLSAVRGGLTKYARALAEAEEAVARAKAKAV